MWWNHDVSNHLEKSKLVLIIRRSKKPGVKLWCLIGEGMLDLVWIRLRAVSLFSVVRRAKCEKANSHARD